MFLKIFKKESPKWLNQKQHNEMALHSYESIYNREYAESEVGKIKSLQENEEQTLSKIMKKITFLSSYAAKMELPKE